MIEFLMANWIIVVIALIFFSYMAFLFVTKQWERLRKIAYGLMLAAERTYSDYQWKEKFDTVLDDLYAKFMPTWLKFFVRKEQIKIKVQLWYDQAKKWMVTEKMLE